MLSYQHRFHAGNHADVLKHAVLLGALEQLAQKPKNFFVLDTHAGEGLYDIGAETKADENVAVYIKSLQSKQSIVNTYDYLLSAFHEQHKYPGSPMLIKMFIERYCQQKVSFHANELAKIPYERLADALGSSAFVHNKNAFDIILQLLPPQPRRGLLIFDPPYEQSIEYKQVYEAVINAYKLWPTGVFLIWYPLLSPRRVDRKTGRKELNNKSGLSEDLLLRLCQKIEHSILDVRLTLAEKDGDMSMYGSGVCIINPPWKLEQEITSALHEIKRMFSLIGTFTHSADTQVQWLKKPN